MDPLDTYTRVTRVLLVSTSKVNDPESLPGTTLTTRCIYDRGDDDRQWLNRSEQLTDGRHLENVSEFGIDARV